MPFTQYRKCPPLHCVQFRNGGSKPHAKLLGPRQTLRAKKAAQTTSLTVMNAVYSDQDLGSEQAPGDYATIDEVPTAEGAIKVVTRVPSPERAVVGFTNELYDATPTPSSVDDGLYDTPPPGVNGGGGGGGDDVSVRQQQSSSGAIGTLTPRNTDAELYNAAPASTSTAADDGLYDVPSLGSNNDEYLTVTA